MTHSEQIKKLIEEVLAGRHWYWDLDTCLVEERDAVRKKILEVDGKTADLCQLLKAEQDSETER